MLFEFLNHLISLDFGWIANLVIMNLPWVFAVGALAYFFGKGKGALAFFFIIVFEIWTFFDFGPIIGIGVISGTLLGLYYIYRLGSVAFIEGDEKLAKHLFLLLPFTAWAFIVLYALLVVG